VPVLSAASAYARVLIVSRLHAPVLSLLDALFQRLMLGKATQSTCLNKQRGMPAGAACFHPRCQTDALPA
jgi:hypothetical protein